MRTTEARENIGCPSSESECGGEDLEILLLREERIRRSGWCWCHHSRVGADGDARKRRAHSREESGGERDGHRRAELRKGIAWATAAATPCLAGGIAIRRHFSFLSYRSLSRIFPWWTSFRFSHPPSFP